AANAVIAKNAARKPKRLWTDRGRGPSLRLVAAPSDEAEAKYVADEIIRVSYEEKIPLREIAVLYRTNAQARPFEEALRLGGVRYRVVGGTSLFDRKEVRDLVAYLRAALNPRDEVALLRIVNVPARGIGDQTVARAQELARARKVEAVQSLLRQLIEYEQREEQRAAEDTEDSEPFAAGLSGYLARITLDSREADGDSWDAVTLMTLHGAKGLEWRCVFLCGME